MSKATQRVLLYAEDKLVSIARYVILPHTARILVGGVSNEIGLLGDIRQAPQGYADIDRGVVAAWSGRTMPRAAIRRDGLVVAWENGMTRTNDFDWERLPVLGLAIPDAYGTLRLHSDVAPGRPMSLREAVTEGICGPDGTFGIHRRPRVVHAEMADGHVLRSANPSSRGFHEIRHHVLSVRLDTGDTVRVSDAEAVSGDALARVGQAVIGMTVDEAADWMYANRTRDWVPEMERVVALEEPGVVLRTAGPNAIELRPRDGGIELVTRLAGAGGVMFPESALRDAGDRLAEMDVTSIRFVFTSDCPGRLRLRVSDPEGFEIVLRSGDGGSASVVCSVVRDGEALDDETIGIPPEAVGPFLADFSDYLALCGAASVREERVPTFGEFLSDIGVDYQPTDGTLRL